MELLLVLLGNAYDSQLISDISIKDHNLMSGKIFSRVVAEPHTTYYAFRQLYF